MSKRDLTRRLMEVSVSIDPPSIPLGDDKVWLVVFCEVCGVGVYDWFQISPKSNPDTAISKQ